MSRASSRSRQADRHRPQQAAREVGRHARQPASSPTRSAVAPACRRNIPGMAMPVPYPPVPIVTFDEEQREHPALFRLNQIGLPYVGPLALNDNVKGDKEVKRTVLARSTKYVVADGGRHHRPQGRASSGRSPATAGRTCWASRSRASLPSAFARPRQQLTEGGAPRRRKIKAPERAEKPVHVLVFGSRLLHARRVPAAAAAGAARASAARSRSRSTSIDWLAQDSDLIEIRAKNVEDPTLEVPQNVKRSREHDSSRRSKNRTKPRPRRRSSSAKKAMKAWDERKANYRWGNTLAIPGRLRAARSRALARAACAQSPLKL